MTIVQKSVVVFLSIEYLTVETAFGSASRFSCYQNLLIAVQEPVAVAEQMSTEILPQVLWTALPVQQEGEPICIVL